MMTGKVLYSKDKHVGRIVFSNLEKRNAMSLGMWQELADTVAQATADENIRVLILAGDGDLAFVSGSDISGFAESRSSLDATHKYNATVEAALLRLASCQKPTLAAIRGFCVGGGVSIAAACDIRIGGNAASFAVPAARLGIGYSAQQILRLQHLVGPANLRDIVFTGRRLGADEALRIGFLTRLVPDSDVAVASAELAGQMAANAPLTIAAAKEASNQALQSASERAPATLDALIAACFASDDYREGQAAFLEKRKPAFTGR